MYLIHQRLLSTICRFESASQLLTIGSSKPNLSFKRLQPTASCLRIFSTVKNAGDLKIHVGDHDFCSKNKSKSYSELRIKEIIFHYNYVRSTPLANDIAVIILQDKIKFDRAVRPIRLANEEYKEFEYENTTNLLLSGWGNIVQGSPHDKGFKPIYPTKLRKTTNLTVRNLEDCNKIKYYQLTGLMNISSEMTYKNLSHKFKGVFHKQICISGKDEGSPSFGDSGGPLAAMDENWQNPYLVGVVSHMQKYSIRNSNGTSSSEELHFFSKVSSYLKWILVTFKNEC